MPVTVEIKLPPRQAADAALCLETAAAAAGVSPAQVAYSRVVRRSIDARKRGAIVVNMAVELYIDNEARPVPVHLEWGDVGGRTPVVVVGSGPAGLFAALELIELGYRPIVVERGRNVSERKLDVAAINRNEPIDSDSNYAFGEGGAGTYSDGKLFTRSKKRGDHRKTLEIFHHHGAPEEILYEAHPHIGTDKLPDVIASIRQTIEQAGGSVLFGRRVTDLILEKGRAAGVVTASGERIEGAAVLLATGHSARDVYEMLHGRDILIESKPFAMGLRVEHQQALIDRIQYKTDERDPCLPAATYSLVAQAGERGVYSFCMCPGGFIVPAGTAPGECVVNGMSPSGRNNRFANAGIVTQVLPEDYADLVPHFGPLAGLRFQQNLEKMAYAQGGGAQVAPAQRLDSFMRGFKGAGVLPTSYHPGLVESDIDKWLPRFMTKALREGLKQFDNKMRGFLTPEAQVIGVESRTSSPVRIPRSPETHMHTTVEGLFPAGEGAGYAGGIVSAAVDGAATAGKIALWLNK